MKANLQKFIKDNQVSMFDLTGEEIPTERWKWVEEFGERYKVSDLGNVKSYIERDNPKELTKVYDGQRYYKVNLHYEGKQYNRRIHRLVAEAFIPNPEGKKRIKHKDKNYLNNQVSNLEWY